MLEKQRVNEKNCPVAHAPKIFDDSDFKCMRKRQRREKNTVGKKRRTKRKQLDQKPPRPIDGWEGATFH